VRHQRNGCDGAEHHGSEHDADCLVHQVDFLPSARILPIPGRLCVQNTF
jgi:hypothetical protein